MRKPYITIGHVVVEIVTFALVIASLVMALTSKGTVPIHMNMMGTADSYGTAIKYLPAVFILAGFDILLGCIVFFAPAKMFNAPFKINPNNANLVYRDMTLMILGIQLMLTITIFVTMLSTIVLRDNAGRAIIVVNTVCGILGMVIIVAGFIGAAVDNKR